MNNQGEVKLSSNWTGIGLYISAFFILIMSPIVIFSNLDQDFHMGMLLSAAVFLASVSFLIYLFAYSCDARIVGDKIVLKKQFRPAKSYTFDQIGYPTSFQLKKTKYITVEMKDNQAMEKYIIINSRSLFSSSKDAEQTLINLRNLARRQ
ncbi:hypothetical protein [Fulvivirga sediminis]|uniref:Uncharacterized protein n=1 Tax=Fulvivirga sediminis TaxID=2803949 RepID=A0A937F9X4_9BACT|nr:hypothetical protein [Fulvivirga sediminis]MBL3657931.1 hypothetical protein [Fulvivirga sediminis]